MKDSNDIMILSMWMCNHQSPYMFSSVHKPILCLFRKKWSVLNT